MSKYKILSLFSGIGGLCSLPLKVAGLEHKFEVAQFVECESFCQKVLKHHFPSTPVHGDIRTFTAQPGQFDVVVGGSPCVDISVANARGKGLDGERSGLWFEMLRIIEECRPKAVLWENVAAARSLRKGQNEPALATVIKGLDELGYTCNWDIISAASQGGVHLRERILLWAFLRP